jgi:hypothetical protein
MMSRSARWTGTMQETKSPTPMSEAEYQALESTVAQTARGRWFLAEYARRNRTMDTQALLGAICRLEEAVERARRGPDMERLRFNLVEMARMLAHTRNEVAALRPATAQRVDQAIHVMRFLESRVNAMLEVWSSDGTGGTADPDAAQHTLQSDAAADAESFDQRLQ